MPQTAPASAPATTSAQPEELAEVVGQLRRAIRCRVRAAWAAAPLPEAQLELLRLVRAGEGIRVREAAAQLRLAHNTVSTLVKQLAAVGLLEKRPDPADGRAGRLFLTGDAVELMAAWRARRREVLADALRELPREQRDAIVAALPALARLVELLGSSPPAARGTSRG
jgi:DNA-binding MarR family transcriptional regulator